jgi:glycosyltransferase involved in cell wall biosynthesis
MTGPTAGMTSDTGSAFSNLSASVRSPNLDQRQTLLAICPVSPWPVRDGMSLRVSRLLERLATRWKVVLVCPAGGETGASNGVALAAEINFPRLAQWMYVPSQYDIEPVVRTVGAAVEAHRPAATLLWGGMEYLRKHIPALPPSVSDRVDSMTLSAWRQLLHSHKGNSLRQRFAQFSYNARYEFSMRHASEAMVVVGESDAGVLRRFLRVKNVHVLPNGVEVTAPLDVARAPRPTVMFTGVLNYQPNIDAVVYFADEIWDKVRMSVPDAVFQIVGRSPAPEVSALASRPGIEVHADVESVRAFLTLAWLAVAPMRTGCGIKNKVLEAWAVGTPAVMTPIATNGLQHAPSDLLVTGEGQEMADTIVSLLRDESRRNALGLLARTTALKAFSWDAPAAALSVLLEQVVRKPNAVGTAPTVHA